MNLNDSQPALLMVPTLDQALARRCLDSLLADPHREGVRAIAVYNGTDSAVGSWRDGDRVRLIGRAQSAAIAQAAADAADCPEELLFGDPAWGRSYGGASNLLLAIAWLLGPATVAKVDDDCLDPRPQGQAWLDSARACVAGAPTAVHFGHSLIRPSGEIGQLPRALARGVGRIVYSKAQRAERIGGGSACGATLKNGILAFHTCLIPRACYAVLREPVSGVHLRGEIYWWAAGFGGEAAFRFSPGLSLGHSPVGPHDLQGWLHASLAGADFWFVHRHRFSKGCFPSLDRRRARLALIRAWVRRSEWPPAIDPDRLLEMLREDRQLPFTDRIHGEEPARREAWRRLTTLDARLRTRLAEQVEVQLAAWPAAAAPSPPPPTRQATSPVAAPSRPDFSMEGDLE